MGGRWCAETGRYWVVGAGWWWLRQRRRFVAGVMVGCGAAFVAGVTSGGVSGGEHVSHRMLDLHLTPGDVRWRQYRIPSTRG